MVIENLHLNETSTQNVISTMYEEKTYTTYKALCTTGYAERLSFLSAFGGSK